MKHKKHFQEQNQNPANDSRSGATASLDSDETNFVPSPDEVARRAYFSYVNQGSPDGQKVQHWLAAEAELIAERNQTRVHGFQHKP